VFVHIPKTGGQSVEKTLFPEMEPPKETNYDIFTGWDEKNKIWMQHASMQQINDLYETDVSKYFKFGFVRNPWSRAVSDYVWMQEEIKKSDSFLNYLLEQGEFKQRLTVRRNNRWRGDHVIPQFDFLFDNSGTQLVDFIGKLENFQSDFDIVCDKIGIPRKKLSRQLIAKKRKHYTEYYDDETRQIVAEKYAKDIEMFGYEFGE
jgi:hypothetical protein